MDRPINFDNPGTCTRQLVSRAGALPLRVRRRRGSVLVLVVGVLALLAIVVLVYSSIGQSDKRTAVSVRDKALLNGYSEQIGSYIAQQIADGATSVSYDQPLWRNAAINNKTSRPVRKGSTYPSTDIEARSVPLDPAQPPTSTDGVAASGNERRRVDPSSFSHFRFRPSGTVTNDWYASGNLLVTNMADQRRAADPYLSVDQPTFLNVAGGTAANWGRPEILTDFKLLPRYKRDLAHISNLAPDGRFVNLANLRGNFNAASGVGIDPVTGRPRTTYGLTLLNGRNPNQYTLTMADIDSNVPPSTPAVGTAQYLWNGAVADLNVPWHWSTNQHGVARPVGDSPRGTIGGGNFAFGEYGHLSNQWADTDGDGIYDARWFELVDLSFGVSRLLGDTGNLRLFVAAKVIDLSGKANVNVGTDLNEPALTNKPLPIMGLTPSDYDLERLLTGQWGRDYYATGPEAYAQPLGTNATLAGNYTNFGLSNNWIQIGKAGYAGLIASRIEGKLVQREYTWTDSDLSQYTYLQRPAKGPIGASAIVSRSTGTNSSAIFPQTGPMDSQSRELLYRFASRESSGANLRNTLPSATEKYQLFFASPFTKPDELELRTYGFVNDPNTTSRLEAAIDGRYDTFENFGPLRSNRPIDAERDRRDGTTNPAPFTAEEQQFRSQLVATRMALTGLRQSLTTYNGSRPLRSGDLSINNPRGWLTGSISLSSLSSGDVQPDIEQLLTQGALFKPTPPNPASASADLDNDALSQRLRKDALKQIFAGVANALLPYSDLNNPTNAASTDRWTWKYDFTPATSIDAEHHRRRALVYAGLRGDIGNTSNPTPAAPEFAGMATDLAIRASAHWTANLIADQDTAPTTGYRGEVYGFTMLLKDDNTTRTALNNGTLLRSGAAPGRTVNGNSMFPYWLIDGDVRGVNAGASKSTAAGFGDAIRDASGLRLAGRLDLGRTTGDDAAPTDPVLGALPTKRLDDGAGAPTRRNYTVTTTTDATLNAGTTPWQGQDALATNVFAMGPQPFLTNVAVLLMYQDADSGGTNGGDGEGIEWTRDPADPTIWIPNQPTINTAFDRTNTDFVFEVVAFELSNPYNVPINLTPTPTAAGASLTPKDFYYYIEFGGQFYKVAAFDYEADATGVNAVAPTNGLVKPVVLQPGSSAVFFASVDKLSTIEQRMARADASVTPGSNVARDLLRSQLTPTGTRFVGPDGPNDPPKQPYRVMPFSPETGLVLDNAVVGTWTGPVWPQDGNPTTNGGLSGASPLRAAPSTLATPAQKSHFYNGQARLWRMVVAPPTQNASTANVNAGSDSAVLTPNESITGSTLRNDIANDVLVDRMRDPARSNVTPTLDRRPPSGVQPIAGVQGGLNPGDMGLGLQNPAVNGNAGFAIILGGSFRRPAATGTTNSGQLPSYCVEAKSSLAPGEIANDDLYVRTNTGRGTVSYNIVEAFVFNGFRYAMANSGQGGPGDDFVAGGTINGGTSGFSGLAPSLISNAKIDGRHAVRSLATPAVSRGDVMPNNQSNIPYNRIAPSINLLSAWQAPVRTPMRPGDLLMPMAVGAYQNPYAFLKTTSSLDDPRNLDVQWLTQSEALGLALDYDRPADPRNNEYNWGRADIAPTATTLARPVAAFDRGHLRLDAFVPFDDIGDATTLNPDRADGIFQPAVLVGGEVVPQDRPLGRGIPAALNLVDIFRTGSWGGISTLAQGKININSATPEVLASLGLLAPWAQRDWVTGGSSTFNNDAKGAFRNTDDPFDLVSTIVAYRDKQFMWSRPSGSKTNAGFTLNPNDPRVPLPFHDGWTPAARLGSVASGTGVMVQNPYLANSRREVTGIPALREQRGFGSLGELLAVRFGPHHGTYGYSSTLPSQAIVNKDQAVDASIDRLGRRFEPNLNGPTKQPLDLTFGSATTSLGWSSQIHAEATGGPARPALAEDSFEHKLAIANSVLPSVSVRSDVFAVTFVVHGYTPDDVDGLKIWSSPADTNDPAVTAPMNPTVKKRFVMVVDRSNVTAQGQKPRVLMLEEVPYN